MKTGRLNVPVELTADYVQREVGRPERLYLLLHGYLQTGQYIFDKLESHLPAGAAVVTPCGPYPIPEKKEDGSYKVGFPWYFYDTATDEYYIDINTVRLFSPCHERG